MSDGVTDSEPGKARPVRKSATAYRTISEVSDDLEVPQHVLRFWETKFSQVRPLKRGGGRRYYRPEDVALLRRIQALLYKDGYTIKGVQRLLREGRGEAPDNGQAGARAAAAAEGEVEATPSLPFADAAISQADAGSAGEAATALPRSVRTELSDLVVELRRLRRLLAGGEPAPGATDKAR